MNMHHKFWCHQGSVRLGAVPWHTCHLCTWDGRPVESVDLAVHTFSGTLCH